MDLSDDERDRAVLALMFEPRHRRIEPGLSSKSLLVWVQCPACFTEELVEVDALGYATWHLDRPIQECLPQATRRDREKLQTGFCDKCQDEMFGEGVGR